MLVLAFIHSRGGSLFCRGGGNKAGRRVIRIKLFCRFLNVFWVAGIDRKRAMVNVIS